MWNPVVILVLGLCSFTNAVPLGLKKNMAIVQQEEEPMMMMATDEETRPEVMISRLNLPSNATSIRADITDGFSCDNKTYGYYADVENECQIFHVCLPVTYADGKENTFRWSFICPEETVFSQDSFTCMRPADMSIDCEESFKYYELNRNFGVIDSEDSPSMVDEDMNMEDMSRQPSSQEVEEDRKQMVVAAPVKKQAVKVQSSNRRKTQTNRVAIDAQRRKVQPLRKIPQAAAPAPATAKPLEEDAPILEQEVERTTVKYQRFNKRPVTLVKEPNKPEPFKLEQPLVRTDLFMQKRKRPQIFTPTKIEAESEASQKTEVVLDQQPENNVQDQAEAQASEIAEVSIKPQEEEKKAQPLEVQKKEPVYVYIPIKEEIAPMLESTPSRAEVVEIPIQRVDETLVAAAPIPIVEEPMPIAEIVAPEPVKAEEEKLLNEELLAEQSMQAELTKILKEVQKQEVQPEKVLEAEKTLETPSEDEKPVEAEKEVLETVPEIVQMLEAVKAVTLPVEKPAELEVPASESVKAIESVVKPEVPAVEPQVVETPAEIQVPVAEPDMPAKIETDSEPLRLEVPSPMPVLEAEAPVAEAEKPLDAEVPAVEPEVLLKSETPIAESVKPSEIEVPALVPEIPLIVESAVPEMPLVVEALVPEMPLAVELPVSVPEMTLKIEAPIEPESVEPVPTTDVEITKTVLPTAEKPAQIEISAEPLTALNPEPQMPAEADLSPQQMSEEPQIPTEAEKTGELVVEEAAAEPSEQMEVQPQSTDKETVQSPAAESEDTQSLILDFISSLVNSENSNLEEQTKPMDEEQAASVPVPAVAMAEEKPAEVQADPEQPNPMYVPMMQDNEQMYQIPVQIIETPEPEPVPVAAEPKLPLSIDDVVELVKESLDTPAEKENLIQEPLVANSDEVKPIYHRYLELGSNLLKSEALTASDEDEPTIVAAANDDSTAQEDQVQKAAEQLPEPEQLAPVPETAAAVNTIPLPAEPAYPTEDSLPMSRSLNHFRMDPRKRRFLFRSDAS